MLGAVLHAFSSANVAYRGRLSLAELMQLPVKILLERCVVLVNAHPFIAVVFHLLHTEAGKKNLGDRKLAELNN